VLLLLPITAKVKAHELRGKNKQELLQQVGAPFNTGCLRAQQCPAVAYYLPARFRHCLDVLGGTCSS